MFCRLNYLFASRWDFEYVATNRYSGAYILGVYDTSDGLGINFLR
jgi:hypothetical protein